MYFDDIGQNAAKMLGYFEREGVRPCTPEENPAEYILEAIRPTGTQDWSVTWKSSPENEQVQRELKELISKGITLLFVSFYYFIYLCLGSQHHSDDGNAKEFATSTWTQLKVVYNRFNLTLWRNPSYMYVLFHY